MKHVNIWTTTIQSSCNTKNRTALVNYRKIAVTKTNRGPRLKCFNNTRKTTMASTSTVGTFEDLSIDIPVEARSWGTKFRFYQPHYGDDVNAPMNAEFLVNSYVTEVFNLATKDCWSLKDG